MQHHAVVMQEWHQGEKQGVRMAGDIGKAARRCPHKAKVGVLVAKVVVLVAKVLVEKLGAPVASAPPPRSNLHPAPPPRRNSNQPSSVLDDSHAPNHQRTPIHHPHHRPTHLPHKRNKAEAAARRRKRKKPSTLWSLIPQQTSLLHSKHP